MRALVGAVLVTLATHAWSQSFPSKPVHIIVPFPPGGYTDVTARIIAQSLTERLGQPFIVDNRPGASTVIGTEAAARAQPDGYTLLLTGSSTFAVNPVLLHNLPYDPLKSFVSVGIVTRTPRQPEVGYPQPLPSRLTVEGERPKLAAIRRIDRPAATPREISSR